MLGYVSVETVPLLGWVFLRGEMLREKGKDTCRSKLRVHRRCRLGVSDLALEDSVDIAVEDREGVACSG